MLLEIDLGAPQAHGICSHKSQQLNINAHTGTAITWAPLFVRILTDVHIILLGCAHGRNAGFLQSANPNQM